LVVDNPKGKQTSIFTSLAMKDRQFWSSAQQLPSDSSTPFASVLALARKEDGSIEFLPTLGDIAGRWISFQSWWEEVIFKTVEGYRLTRGDIVFIARNQDGVAHADPKLDERYAALSRKNSLGFSVVGPNGAEPIFGPEVAALRQIAHEVLVTMNPDMPRIVRQGEVHHYPASYFGFELRTLFAATRIGGLNRNVGELVDDHTYYLPLTFLGTKPRPSDPCPCGGAWTFGLCHGRPEPAVPGTAGPQPGG